MEKEIFNGQILSEQEMREVLGGHVLVQAEDPDMCPVCNCETFIYKKINDKDKKFVCTNCGTIIDFN